MKTVRRGADEDYETWLQFGYESSSGVSLSTVNSHLTWVVVLASLLYEL